MATKVDTPLDIRDRYAVAEASRAGDLLNVMRLVEHLALFETEEQAVRFWNRVVDLGYRVELKERAIAQSGVKAWQVQCTRMQTVDLDTVQRHSRVLSEEARRHGGMYQGSQWEPVLSLRNLRPNWEC